MCICFRYIVYLRLANGKNTIRRSLQPKSSSNYISHLILLQNQVIERFREFFFHFSYGYACYERIIRTKLLTSLIKLMYNIASYPKKNCKYGILCDTYKKPTALDFLHISQTTYNSFPSGLM